MKHGYQKHVINCTVNMRHKQGFIKGDVSMS